MSHQDIESKMRERERDENLVNFGCMQSGKTFKTKKHRNTKLLGRLISMTALSALSLYVVNKGRTGRGIDGVITF